jgi:predicted MPP superfamily phosphohydrolase
MKRRHFLSSISAGVATSCCAPFLESCNTKNVATFRLSHNSTSLETTIAIDGLAKPVSIFQITDSHISCDNKSDHEYEKYSARMNAAFPLVEHYKTHEKVTPVQCFRELTTLAEKEKTDLIVLTGDIVNYPSATAVSEICKMLEENSIKYVYTAGNHDWHYEGMPGTADKLREEWCEKRLKPLYASNPLYSSMLLGGVNIVTIDNSTYQITDEQLSFFKQQQSKPEPVALFMHIPIYLPGMRICCGHPDWGAHSDTNFEIERRERWPETGNRAPTTEFVKQVFQTKQLAGVFTGHWHQSRIIACGDKIQYVTGGAFNGQYRLIRFIPLENKI